MIGGLLFCNFYETKFIFIDLINSLNFFYAFGTKFIKQIDFKAIFLEVAVGTMLTHYSICKGE